jgi:hypothetical protein
MESQQDVQEEATIAASAAAVATASAAELRRGCLEFQLLHACNEQAAARLRLVIAELEGATKALRAYPESRATEQHRVELDRAIVELEMATERLGPMLF